MNSNNSVAKHCSSYIYICIDSATLRFEAIGTPTPPYLSGKPTASNPAPHEKALRRKAVANV